MNPGTKDIIGLAARLAVGGIFIYAGVTKALAPAEEFAYAIESYRVLNSQLSLYAAYVTPWVELYAGLLLAAGVFTRWSALFSGVMLVFFELLLGQAWLRKLPITSCGCFGTSGSNSIAGEFLQNLAFLALAAAAFKYGRAWSADRAVEKP
ncbi:MAG: hypothetical protein A2X31_11665 [Elusimicrobia bacterium GWB2_63_22]|nr:MAG: hypothetical protein A2X31_11665 [Elusimicrobia bacterium GWB2_63_22]